MKAMDDLIALVAKLRSPEGCPWDREQTPQSLVPYILEEAYELAAAIESGDKSAWKEELGDYLFQVVLQAQIASEEKHFDFALVAQALTEKMTRRHPHVFGTEKWKTADEVVKNWQSRKEAEKKSQGKSTAGPEAEEHKMPALMASYKIGKNSEKWKFDWDTPEQVLAKVDEEKNEILEALKAISASRPVAVVAATEATKEQEHLEEEFGDFLFAASQWARHLKIDPETALRKANRKYQLRFRTMIQDCKLSQAEFAALPLAQKEELWQQTKKKLKAPKG